MSKKAVELTLQTVVIAALLLVVLVVLFVIFVKGISPVTMTLENCEARNGDCVATQDGNSATCGDKPFFGSCKTTDGKKGICCGRV